MRNICSNEILPSLFVNCQNSNDKSRIENPCYPQNYKTAITTKHLYGSLCTANKRPENYSLSQAISVIGTGDPALCREAVSGLFDFTSCREKEDCSFNGIYQPKVKGNFVVRFLSFLLLFLQGDHYFSCSLCCIVLYCIGMLFNICQQATVGQVDAKAEQMCLK